MTVYVVIRDSGNDDGLVQVDGVFTVEATAYQHRQVLSNEGHLGVEVFPSTLVDAG
jgi:hypothetical protein